MACNIQLEPSGHSFTVENGETVLDAALRQGIGLPYGCRNGACGNCVGKLKEGSVDYGDPEPVALPRLDRAAGEALLCQAYALTDLRLEVQEVATSASTQPRKLPCRVDEMIQLAHDVMRIYLKLPESERMQFLAGQYVDFILADGRKRSFSLANAPHQDERLELHIRHVPDGVFTEHVFTKMKEKDLLRIEGPLGSFYLREDSKLPMILIAGGTGFAPIKGMIEHAFASGITRPMHLYWGARAKRDLYQHDLAQSWADAHANFQYTPVLSEAMPEDQWNGRTGFVHQAVMADYADLSGFEVYASGPPPMVYGARDGMVTQGLVADRFYSDAFEYAADTKPGA